jgi:hypothetical protein
MEKFLDFGSYGVKRLTELLFWAGSLGVAVASWFIGHGVSAANVWHRTVQQADGWWTGVAQNNWPLGIFVGLLCFVIGILFWRLVCEMIYIILNYFKENTKGKECGESHCETTTPDRS